MQSSHKIIFQTYKTKSGLAQPLGKLLRQQMGTGSTLPKLATSRPTSARPYMLHYLFLPWKKTGEEETGSDIPRRGTTLIFAGCLNVPGKHPLPLAIGDISGSKSKAKEMPLHCSFLPEWL